MLIAVWRVKGATFNVDDFLETHTLAVDLVWRVGESRRKHQRFDTSGFSLSLDSSTSDPSWEHMIDDIRSFLIENTSIIEALHQLDVRQEIDIGFTVGYKPFTRSLRFSPDLLSMFVDLQIDVVASAYPQG